MKTRTKVWLTVAAAFTALNVAFVFIVGTHDGLLHPGAHALLALAGGYWVWRVARASTPSAAARAGRAAPSAPLRGVAEQLERIEQNVAVVAVEVERIGEGQRFMAQLVAEPGTADAVPVKPAAPPV